VSGKAFASEAQLLTSQLGKVVRINKDGSIPADNPYAANADPLTRAVWSYGTPQSPGGRAASGDGRTLGDRTRTAGRRRGQSCSTTRNFGWPNVSYGCSYGATPGTACRIGGGTHAAPYTPPLAFWYATSTRAWWSGVLHRR